MISFFLILVPETRRNSLDDGCKWIGSFFIIFTSKIADSGYVNLVDLVSKLAPRPYRNISFDLSFVGAGIVWCGFWRIFSADIPW